jgi:hypothetical protein
MKVILPILFLTVALSCQKTPPSPSETTESPSTPTTSDTLRVSTPPTEAEPMTLYQLDDILELRINGKKLLSFKAPDSADVQVTTGADGRLGADWPATALVAYKSFYFSFRQGDCTFGSDEGTATEFVDTLDHGPGFTHSSFDNRAAGADGIEEMYDLVYEGYCIRFNWTLGMSYNATPDDRNKEILKMEKFLKTVSFE